MIYKHMDTAQIEQYAMDQCQKVEEQWKRQWENEQMILESQPKETQLLVEETQLLVEEARQRFNNESSSSASSSNAYCTAHITEEMIADMQRPSEQKISRMKIEDMNPIQIGLRAMHITNEMKNKNIYAFECFDALVKKLQSTNDNCEKNELSILENWAELKIKEMQQTEATHIQDIEDRK